MTGGGPPIEWPPSRARPGGEETTDTATTDDLLTLALLGLTPPRTAALLARGPLPDVLAHPGHHADLLTAAAVARLSDGRARRAAEDERRRAALHGARVIGRDDAEYPAWLRQIYDPPLVLFVKGTLRPAEGAHSVAVVGARKVSAGGATLARALARDLAEAGFTIVSGLARGTDTAAHRGALDARGRTVAVLGNGLDRPYPPENGPLMSEIAESGAVVSELPVGAAPFAAHFPRRNRVIAGWARAVVVVEAAVTSGSLHTARCALDEGREVMAVPGHPSQENAAGTNQLIRDGASLVRHATDVLDALGLVERNRARPSTAPEDPLLGALTADAPRGLEELRERSGLETPALLARLTELELQSRVVRLPGALYVRHH